MKLGRLLLRLVVGGYFFGHGTQKLFGWFGGHGPEGTGQFFEQIGIRPGKRNAVAAGAAEAGGGVALVLGAATPLAAGAIISVMLTAIHRVHLSKGPWVAEGGYEYNLVLIAAMLALAEVGPGQPSIDSALGWEEGGVGAVLAALALGVGGAAGAHYAAESQSSEAPAGSSAEAAAPEAAADAGAPTAAEGAAPASS